MRTTFLALTLALCAGPALAQSVSLTTGTCSIREGAGSPEGAVAGNICDHYTNTSNGTVWLKLTGSNTTTGWVQLPSTFPVSAAQGGTGLNTSSWSGIPSVNAGAWTQNNVLTSGRVLYAGASNTVASSAGLVFDGSNLGIGATPAERLTVVSGDDVAATNIALFKSNNLTAGTGIGWEGIRRYSTGTNARYLVDAKGTGNLLLQTVATGNVGIGTTAPLAKLAINGGLHVGGDSDPGNDNALIDGILTVSGFGTHQFSASGTGGASVTVRNTLAGATNFGAVDVGNDLSGTRLRLTSLSSTFTPGGLNAPDRSMIVGSGTNGLAIVATGGAGGDIHFGTNTGAVRGTMHDSGIFEWLNRIDIGSHFLPITNYTSDIGQLTKKFLQLHAAELWVETLVAQETIATIGGRILVGPTTTLTTDLNAVTSSIVVKHNEMAVNDVVVLEANGQVEWMDVSSGPTGTGPYTYVMNRNRDGTGANEWPAGTAIFNTGTIGEGFIDLYSIHGIKAATEFGPTITGNVRTAGTYNAYAPRWAVGNLNGLYGYAATTFGFAAGDPAGTNVTVDATNGFRVRSGGSNKFSADASGNLALTGDLVHGTGGVFRSGTVTNFTTGTGVYFDYNAGNPRFRVGNPAGNQMKFETSTGVLEVTGTITASAGAIGGFSLGADFIRDAANSFGLASTVSGSDDVRFWAGNTFANRATAPFRVTEAGVITATSGTIGGFSLSATTVSATNLTLTSGAANTAHIAAGTGSNLAGLNSANAAGDVALWAGATHANRATAVTRILADGTLVSGTFTSDAAGLRIASATAIGDTSAYRFTLLGNDTGSHGLYGFSNTTNGGANSAKSLFLGALNLRTDSTNNGADINVAARVDAADTNNASLELHAGEGSIVPPFLALRTKTNSGGVRTVTYTMNATGAVTLTGNTSLTTDGTVRMTNYGAGTATFDASGNISSASDGRLKEHVEPYRAGLREVLSLRPVTFHWNATSGLDREHRYAGFIAQDVAAVLPFAFGIDSRGYLTLHDRAILGATVGAIQQLHAELDALKRETAQLKERHE